MMLHYTVFPVFIKELKVSFFPHELKYFFKKAIIPTYANT